MTSDDRPEDQLIENQGVFDEFARSSQTLVGTSRKGWLSNKMCCLEERIREPHVLSAYKCLWWYIRENINIWISDVYVFPNMILIQHMFHVSPESFPGICQTVLLFRVFFWIPLKMPFSLFQDMTVRSCFLHNFQLSNWISIWIKWAATSASEKNMVSKGDYPQITERLRL